MTHLLALVLYSSHGFLGTDEQAGTAIWDEKAQDRGILSRKNLALINQFILDDPLSASTSISQYYLLSSDNERKQIISFIILKLTVSC